MISNPSFYLLSLAFIVTFFYLLESRLKPRFMRYIPAVVMIYATSMLFASMGLFDTNAEIERVYTLTKTNLLPAMLFLILLQLDIRAFARLGKSLILAYVLALLSLAFAFVLVLFLFDFSLEITTAFGALAGSWMGGVANMIAVGEALGVSERAFAYIFVVDSVNYTLWVMLLLLIVPFAAKFNSYTNARYGDKNLDELGCACSMGAPRYWLLISLSLGVSLLCGLFAEWFVLLNATTSTVLFATLLGVAGSFTRARNISGSQEIATTMLYVIIALIGSQAVIENFSGMGVYVFAGFMILLIHAVVMLIGAKLFKLDLFTIAVASLANIGGVASAPILAASYHKNLVGVGVLMAIMGYLVGTFGGLVVGNILVEMSR